MAYDGQIKMSFQAKDGSYYTTGAQQPNGTWPISTTAATAYINHLPDGWDSSAITWQRNPNYMGVFRSLASSTAFNFSKDGRAIIKNVRNTLGIQSFLMLNIYVWNEATFNYDLAYKSNIDFTTYSDDIQNEYLTIGTLDCSLIRDIHAYGGTSYNVPVWLSNGAGGWNFNADAWIRHRGIKLLYNATFNSSASDSDPIEFYSGSSSGLLGFDRGAHGVNQGHHYVFSLAQYNITQNNGATTFIGNTILEAALRQGNQVPSAAQSDNNEISFSESGSSQPYTRSNYSLKNATVNNETLVMNAAISGVFKVFDHGDGNATVGPGLSGTGHSGVTLTFALFEVGPRDEVTFDPGNPGHYLPIPIMEIDLPDDNGDYLTLPTGVDAAGNPIYGFSNYEGGKVPGFFPDGTPFLASPGPTQITIKPDRVYILCAIYDANGGLDEASQISFTLTNFQFSIFSKYDYGQSGVPVAAPYLNSSELAAFRISSLFDKIVNYLPTTSTDLYGFPIAAGAPYSFRSDYLTNRDLSPFYDCVPWQLLISSMYCIHNLEGQSYVSISFAQLFNFCKRVLGCGCSIEYDSSGEPTILRVEPLAYFFDNATQILDLGFDVFGLKIEPYTENTGSNLKIGYTKVNTNSNFGIDPFNTELYYNTPVSIVPGTIDLEEEAVLVDQYGIEIGRGQQNNQPINTSYDPANPSSDNQTIALYVHRETTTGPISVVDAGNNQVVVNAYDLIQRDATYPPAAQSTDPNATAAPYISGPYYPDTTINVEISPGRNIRRIGCLIRSYMDNLDASYLTFRNSSAMQYNNVALPVPFNSSNLVIGGGAATLIKESQDILIGSLDAPLFRPYLLKFKSKYPLNLYTIIKENPKGYISFKTQDIQGNVKTWKGFIYKAKQNIGTDAVTDFELLATADMVI